LRKSSCRVVDGDEGSKKIVATKGQILSEVVGNVKQSRNVSDEKLQLGDAILKPMQPHVTGLFESLGFNVRLAIPTATSLSQ
jgi:hypothetical protein